VVALRDADGAALAGWRAHGAGRIGVATFDESYRLALAGRSDLHGQLWGTLFSILARPDGKAGPDVDDGDARTGQRVAICGLSTGATVEAPDGHRSTLFVDPATGPATCAGFWPRTAGWHRLQARGSGQTGDAETSHAFFVRPAAEAPGLHAAAIAAATRRLAASAGTAGADAAALPETPGPRWPWFLGWLALAAAGWWFERTRLGTARGEADSSAPTAS